MTQRRNSKSQGKRDVKSSFSKNGRSSESGDASPGAGQSSGPARSWFSLVVVLALIGLWSSMAVVYFDVVDYDSVLARAKEFRQNFTNVLQGKLSAYDSDGDGDFDLEDAKVLLDETRPGPNSTGLKSAERPAEPPTPEEQTGSRPTEATETELEMKLQREEPAESHGTDPIQSRDPEMVQSHDQQTQEEPESQNDVESDIQDAVALPDPEDSFIPDNNRGESVFSHVSEDKPAPIDSTGVLVKEPEPQETVLESGQYLTSSKVTQEAATEEREPKTEAETQSERTEQTEETTASQSDGTLQEKEKVKKKKPKLLNKFDKSIKTEIDAAEKLRKKGKVEEALQAFEALVQKYPQSPRVRYGKAQSEDDVAEKRRSNEMLQRAINTYREASELPDVTPDLLKAALKRRAERQQFLGRTRGSLMTLERLVEIFPEDYSLKNELGVSHLLLGDNKGAKAVYEQVLSVAPDNGFAKVHYGFILKSENLIAESIPYLQEGLESGDPGTDDGRFYFHLGDALQRVGLREEAHRWYERGHQKGHFSSVWQRSLYNVEGLKAQPWWTPRETGYTDLVKTLERNWKTIRDEALAVMDQKSGLFLPEEENLRETGEWGQYTLWQQGRKTGNACQNVPKTCGLMEKFPEATGCKRGQIKFSVMHPGTHVWPHTGPTNCRLRLHLGLVIPKTGCRIRCTDSIREWEEGKVLIFDDSFEHEVWQDADSFRLIFIIDVWHPELTPYQRQTLSPI
ncbi:aspartyl/asparaginyl beta-hydroxylase isoform X6 [Periophthalmus magnuspinnatus]|uniref:aspartyl/asparaginyl beta-hydroxylase isoform X6 n=1 Tax=Periophthalmus magnuspinnatus TaxID=409849 RepID=UPI002436495B|nr:aspartyl/asparaginyl beta-hydroxylase isoform X6 [Periophthalmus magnuspinnatus]